jgi:hypothetical protein
MIVTLEAFKLKFFILHLHQSYAVRWLMSQTPRGSPRLYSPAGDLSASLVH